VYGFLTASRKAGTRCFCTKLGKRRDTNVEQLRNSEKEFLAQPTSSPDHTRAGTTLSGWSTIAVDASSVL